MSDRDSVSHISEGGANRPLKYELCAFLLPFRISFPFAWQRIQSISVVLCICRLVNVLCVNSYILMRPRATEHILFTKQKTQTTTTTTTTERSEAFALAIGNEIELCGCAFSMKLTDGWNEQQKMHGTEKLRRVNFTFRFFIRRHPFDSYSWTWRSS